MCVYIYIYTHTHTHTHTYAQGDSGTKISILGGDSMGYSEKERFLSNCECSRVGAVRIHKCKSTVNGNKEETLLTVIARMLIV